MRLSSFLRSALALAVLLGGAPASAAALGAGLAQQSSDGQRFFDGAAATRSALEAPPPADGSAAQGASVRLSPSSTESPESRPAVVPAPESARVAARDRRRASLERLEGRLFTISWWLYHASWAVDTTLTGAGIASGRGFEADKLYTLFGRRNVAGVVGSLTALHLGVSALTLMLHRKAQHRHGWSRALMEGAAIGINVFGTIQHIAGALSWIRL